MLPLTQSDKGVKWLYGAAVTAAVIFSAALAKEIYWIFLLPVLLLVAVTAIYRLDMVMLIAVAITPLSINLAKTGLGIGVSLPSEPLIFGIMLLFIAKMLYDNPVSSKVALHPVSLAIIFHIVWMLVTTLTSSMPVVSLKATVARICFVITFFYLGSVVFQNRKKIKTFIWCYAIPLVAVIFYTTGNHAAAGFTEQAAHTSMVPFYNDHTAYAALIAMFIPLFFGFSADKTENKSIRIFSGVTLTLFLTAIVLSYTRASWISLVAGLLCYLVFLLRIKTSVIIGGIVLIISFLLFNWTQLTMFLETNDQESSTDYASHVQSMSNITTDASNVERLNRWNSAFRMFYDRPWFGWGPGTYMFQYAPYQKWSERTIISTNFGEGGNAHSEYIGPLAEQGIAGPFFFILIGVIVIYRASRIIIHSRDPEIRMLTKGLLIGLVTYWVHGMLNNFLDTEKASVPFWAFIGALVAIELYHFKEKEADNKSITD